MGDRDSNLAAHSSSYTASAPLTTSGAYNLSVTFFAAAGETGSTVGTAAAGVSMSANGTLLTSQGQPLGTIDFVGTVKSAAVLASQPLVTGQSGTLTASALDANGQPVVVSPGSFSFQVTSGASALQVGADGSFTATAAGTAQVTASIDGVTSAATSILVTGPPAAPVLSIAWPARTRDVNSPNSALSFSAVFHRTDTSTTDVTVTGDRDSNLAAHSTSYTAGSTVSLAGTYSLAVKFYAAAAQGGQIVGTASTPLTVGPNGVLLNAQGQPLGTINFSGTVKSAVVNPGQSYPVGQTGTLAASALDGNGQPVVVSPGSLTFSLISGSAYLALSPDGSFTAQSVGTASVQVSIDGVTSAAANVAVVVPPPTFKTFQMDTNFLLYDSGRHFVYATTTAADANHPNSVVPIDPATGNLGTAIPLTNSPTWMALSGDGNHLYVGGSNGVIDRLAMPSGSLEGTITCPSGTQPVFMLSVPQTTDTWILSLENSDQSLNTGIVYDGTTARPNTATIGHIFDLNDAGTRLYGFQRFQSSNSLYYTATIDANGIENQTATITAIQGNGNRVHWGNGSVITDSGLIVDPDSGSQLRQLSFTTIGHDTWTTRATNHAYYTAWNSGYFFETFDISTGNLLNSTSMASENLSGGLENPTPCGSNRVIFRTFGGSPNTVTIVYNAP
jgi:hypothetical protein